MRVIAAIALSLVLLLGARFYTKFAESVRRKPAEVQVVYDDGIWDLQIQATCDFVADSEYDAVLVQLKGTDLFSSSETITAGQMIEVQDIKGIEVGANEFYLEANLASFEDPDFVESEHPSAIRVTLRRGQATIATKTFWVDAGETSFIDTVPFRIEAVDSKPPTDDHEH